LNAHLDAVGLDRHARLDADGAARLRTEIDAGRLTGRGYHRVRRTARTLADLAGEVGDVIDDRHVATAVAMRVSMGAERGRG
jgi:magnesium chelatase family protein